VIPPLFFVYCMTYIDRSNVGNAKLFGAQQDNKMTGTQWNIGLSLLCESNGEERWGVGRWSEPIGKSPKPRAMHLAASC
jgi:hypothetical protein